jgi:hypothetical protein
MRTGAARPALAAARDRTGVQGADSSCERGTPELSARYATVGNRLHRTGGNGVSDDR